MIITNFESLDAIYAKLSNNHSPPVTTKHYPVLDIGTIVKIKGQENPDFCAFGTCGSLPYNPVVGSGTSGNGPVGPEILTIHAKQREAE